MLRYTWLFVAGCTLGGTGRPPARRRSTGSGVDQTACAQAMAMAPLAPAGFDYHDALATATRNTWDGVAMPQPGDATLSRRPLPHARRPTPAARPHPGCTVDGLMYTPASIPGYACAAREFPFPDGVDRGHDEADRHPRPRQLRVADRLDEVRAPRSGVADVPRRHGRRAISSPSCCPRRASARSRSTCAPTRSTTRTAPRARTPATRRRTPTTAGRCRCCRSS